MAPMQRTEVIPRLAAIVSIAVVLAACGGGGSGGSQGGTVSVAPASAGSPAPPATTPPAPSGKVQLWVYSSGYFQWAGDYSFALDSLSYTDTSGSPLSPPYDIKVVSEPYGGWQPYGCGSEWQSQRVEGVAVCAALFEWKNPGYTALTFAIKPTVANWSGNVYFVGVGDVSLNCGQSLPGDYGPNPPLANQWNVYTVPLSDLCVAATATLYKFAIQDQTGSQDTWFIDNVGFE